VIVADLYHPSLDGSGALYSREHFAAIRSALAPDGVFCQWLPLHQLDLATLRVIVRTFQSEFPESRAFLAQFSVETPLIALIGGGPRDYADGWLDRRVSDRAMRTRLAELDLKSDVALFGLSIAGAEGLRRFAGEGGLNTDDRPLVTFDAARAAYAADASPGERLVALFDALSPDARLLRDPGAADSALSRRLMAYWRARNRFIEIGARKLVRPDAGDFVADVAPRLIEVVQQSADFDAAYLPVLAMARQLAKRNPVAARTLLEQLDRANPLRPEARRLLAVLPSS
jgi:spermidine synthase